MENNIRCYQVIEQMKIKGIKITAQNMVIQSLFSIGGTLEFTTCRDFLKSNPQII